MFKIFAMCINSIQLYVGASKKAGRVKNVVMSEMKYAFMILQQKIKKTLLNMVSKKARKLPTVLKYRCHIQFFRHKLVSLFNKKRISF